MKARIIQIGKAKTVRLPQSLIDQADLQEVVELAAAPGRIVICGATRPRAGWASAAKRMRDRDEDRLIDRTAATRFDAEEWQWR